MNIEQLARLRVTSGGLLLIIVAYIGIAFAIFSVYQNAHSLNAQVRHNKAVLCQLVRLAQVNSRTSLDSNPEQLARSQRFYANALQLAECEKEH